MCWRHRLQARGYETVTHACWPLEGDVVIVMTTMRRPHGAPPFSPPACLSNALQAPSAGRKESFASSHPCASLVSLSLPRSAGETYFFRALASVLAEGFSIFLADANPVDKPTQVSVGPHRSPSTVSSLTLTLRAATSSLRNPTRPTNIGAASAPRAPPHSTARGCAAEAAVPRPLRPRS